MISLCSGAGHRGAVTSRNRCFSSGSGRVCRYPTGDLRSGVTICTDAASTPTLQRQDRQATVWCDTVRQLAVSPGHISLPSATGGLFTELCGSMRMPSLCKKRVSLFLPISPAVHDRKNCKLSSGYVNTRSTGACQSTGAVKLCHLPTANHLLRLKKKKGDQLATRTRDLLQVRRIRGNQGLCHEINNMFSVFDLHCTADRNWWDNGQRLFSISAGIPPDNECCVQSTFVPASERRSYLMILR